MVACLDPLGFFNALNLKPDRGRATTQLEVKVYSVAGIATLNRDLKTFGNPQ